MSRESRDAFVLLLEGKESEMGGAAWKAGPTVAFDLSSSVGRSPSREGRYSRRGRDTWRGEGWRRSVLSVCLSGLGIDRDGPVAIRGPAEPNGSIGLVWWAGLSVLTDEEYF